MNISFFRNKLKNLKEKDFIKFLSDLVLPDLNQMGDYNPLMDYKKGEKVYYFDPIQQKHTILEAKVDIPAGSEFNPSDWDSVEGTHTHDNEHVLDEINVDEHERLTYKGKRVGANMTVSNEMPEGMLDGDLWFATDESIVPPDPEPPTDGRFCDKIVFKNLKVQPNVPASKDDIWGDTNNNK